LGVFSGVLILMAIWETCAPRRVRVAGRARRSFNNLLMVVVGTLVMRVFPAFSAMTAADWAARSGYGLLNGVEMNAWLEGLLVVVVLDLVIYGQHVATHRLPMLWRFHRVHHADLDLDATSGVRFHPVELLVSMLVKIIAVILLGAAPEAVLIFEITLNGTSIFNHGNVRLPNWIEGVLRCLIVTPDMHRVHHSIRPDETHSNFGFNLPWWDRLFGTYRAQPREPHAHLPLGLPEYRTEAETVPIAKMLWMPLSPLRRSNRPANDE
jgi:sterol desaturase/sphingolipid hydroxylase (fatty acid hydroxylase superfamily)